MVHGVNRKDGERAGSGGVYRVRRLPMSPASQLRAVLSSLPPSLSTAVDQNYGSGLIGSPACQS